VHGGEFDPALVAFGAGYRLVNPVRVTPEGQFFMHPVWSPDGKWIAVTRAKYTGIYLVDPTGRDTTVRELTSDLAAGWGFFWSRDGRVITYRAMVWGPPEDMKTYRVVDVRTGRAHVVSRDSMRLRGTRATILDPSPTATVTFFDDSLRLWVETGDKQRLVANDGQYLNPAMSPDGLAIVAQFDDGKMCVFELADGSAR
jgi:Tol biopolymer transport system component